MMLRCHSTNGTTLGLGSLVLFKARRTAQLRAVLGRIAPANPALFYLLAALGDTTEAMTRARSPEVATRWPGEKATIMAYAVLGKGDTTGAMAALERATNAGEIWPILSPVTEPIFDPLRRSARASAPSRVASDWRTRCRHRRALRRSVRQRHASGTCAASGIAAVNAPGGSRRFLCRVRPKQRPRTVCVRLSIWTPRSDLRFIRCRQRAGAFPGRPSSRACSARETCRRPCHVRDELRELGVARVPA